MRPAVPGTLITHIRQLAGQAELSVQSDAELLERFSAGRDAAAFAGLMQRHAAMVWQVCRNVLHHDQDAEDAFQATFAVLARKAGSIARAGAVASWLHGVAYRVATRASRDAAVRRAREKEGAKAAATRPPLAPPMPSATAATTSLRGFGSSQPNTAPPKSSLRWRGPVSDANPTLALTPEYRSAIAMLRYPKGRDG